MSLVDTTLFAESWNVAFRLKKQGSILEDLDSMFTIIPNSIRYWVADPMVFTYQNHTYIFAELYDYIRCRGILGYSQYDGKKFGKWKPIIIENWHLSYPLIFEYDNNIYIMPESGANKSLDLYKAVDFPDKWEKVKNIINDVNWADTTIYETCGGFEGYTQLIDNENVKSQKIKLDKSFNIISVEDETIYHKKECIRSGGRLFTKGNMTIRVCQDCREDYGRGLYFYCYDNNTNEELETIHLYPEQLKINKNIPLRGMHTYTANEIMEVIDLKTRRFNLINFIFRLLNKLKIER